MTPAQKHLVQTSFEKVKPIADTAAALFYGRLFDLDPTLERLFKGDLEEQGRKLMHLIGLAVKGLNRLDELAPLLRELGARHASYGVTERDYETVSRSLLWTLERGLGEAFTPEVRDAWIAVYELLANSMKAGSREASSPVLQTNDEATTCAGGDRKGWRGYFPAAAHKTSKKRETEMETEKNYETLTGRFNTTIATIVMLIGFLLLVATATSAKTITVTGTGDTIAVDGKITLREAMTAANTNAACGDAPAGDPGLDTIKFNIPGGPFQTIKLTADLPAMVNDPIVIDGTSQPGYAGTPVVELNGDNVATSGLFLQAGNSTVKGLVINRVNGKGIVLSNGGGNTIVGNYIGTNVPGTGALGNAHEGIFVQNSSSNNVIGGNGGRNVISGNGGSGILIFSGTNNIVLGNFVGTNAAGTSALGNSGYGVYISSNGNILGGVGALGANVISGNARGIALTATASGNTVAANFIGTNFDGSAALGNTEMGVDIGGPNNTIGGLGIGARNVISANGGRGIQISGNTASGNVIQGNYIGTDVTGAIARGNGSYGILLTDCANTLIGGTTLAARNIISGNGRGIGIGGASATGNTIQGNYIGVNAAGTAKLTNNGSGVAVSSSGNSIGGTAAGAGNLISGNANDGVSITSTGGNMIQGNLIGTNAAGTGGLGNAGYGIRMIAVSNTTIGGTTPGARNIIAGNGRGVSIEGANSTGNLVQGNYIGVDITGNAKLTNNGSGVSVSGPNNTIGGTVAGAGNVIAGNVNDGVDILDEVATGNKVQGNLIGTNAAGTVAIGNTGEGIRVIAASNSVIGGTTAAARNVISGNFRGITFETFSTGNSVQGNYIGTDITGTVDLGNTQEGLVIYSCYNNTIGGTTAGAGNLVSGNDVDGIRLEGAEAFGNLVQGNRIGTKADGVSLLPNALMGINVYGASKNMIGGTVAGAGNTVAGNNYAGILIASGVGNAVLGNSIFSNARLGIELDPEDAVGLLENDLGDPDFGTNWRQNYPLLKSVTAAGGNTTIQGQLNSNPNKQFRLEFFSNTACDASGFGEGQVFLGSTLVTTDSSGNATINVSLPGNPVGQYVTATATSPTNDTSEFSPCALVGGPNPGALQFESNFFLVEEALGTAKIIVTRTSGMTGAVTVNYATSNGTATAPADYASTSGTLTFGDGEVIKTFTIPIVTDSLAEAQETIGLTLSAPGGGATLGGNSTSILYINDMDPTKPGVMFSNASVVEGDSGSVNAVFTISLTPHTVPITVGYTTASGLATSPDDYTFTSGQFVFGPGENSKTVAVPVLGDTTKEGDEMFFLNLTSLSAGYVIKGQGQGTIIDDDGAPRFQFSGANFSVDEGDGTANITVQRLGDTSVAASVAYSTSDGTAKDGQDYSNAAGTLNFAGGENSKTFAVNITDDQLVEGAETVNLSLTNPSSGAQLGTPNTAVLTILDNEPQPTPDLSISNVTASEGNNATADFAFNVTLSAPSNKTVTVSFDTANGTATSGDYQSAAGQLIFSPGETMQVVHVFVNGDTVPEANDTFFVNLSAPVNANLAKAQGLGTIVDDDTQGTLVQFSEPSYEVSESLTAVTVTVTRSGDTSGTSTVDYFTKDEEATQQSDYEIASGTLTFAPGETTRTIQVLINEDKYVEGEERVALFVTNPTGANLGSQSATVLVINDNDSAESLANPLDDPQSFVHLHYHDFLNREPDQAGLQFWTNEISSCGSDQQCIQAKQINVSAAYFLSIEFQQTGFLLHLLQRESFGSLPKYEPFMRDLQAVSRGVIVNSPGWQQQIADNQQKLAQDWVNRSSFKSVYDAMSNADYVNALYANAGVVPPQAERDGLVTELDKATQTRAEALLEVASNAAFRQQEQNSAFVLMQYFGYLRRDPDSGPDSDLSGYNFWLNKLNAFNGDYQQAEMVRSFLVSSEYRSRFGQQ